MTHEELMAKHRQQLLNTKGAWKKYRIISEYALPTRTAINARTDESAWSQYCLIIWENRIEVPTALIRVKDWVYDEAIDPPVQIKFDPDLIKWDKEYARRVPIDRELNKDNAVLVKDLKKSNAKEVSKDDEV